MLHSLTAELAIILYIYRINDTLYFNFICISFDYSFHLRDNLHRMYIQYVHNKQYKNLTVLILTFLLLYSYASITLLLMKIAVQI